MGTVVSVQKGRMELGLRMAAKCAARRIAADDLELIGFRRGINEFQNEAK